LGVGSSSPWVPGHPTSMCDAFVCLFLKIKNIACKVGKELNSIYKDRHIRVDLSDDEQISFTYWYYEQTLTYLK